MILVAVDVEKREACFSVAHSKVERRVGRKFFYDELFKGSG
jgi:hypothetical protein